MRPQTYAYGYRTRERAEQVIIDDISESLLSPCERPHVASYRTKDGRKLYRILVTDFAREVEA
jgi:hypothetical protein